MAILLLVAAPYILSNSKMHRNFFRAKQILPAGLIPPLVFELNMDEVEKYKLTNGYYIKNDWERTKAIFKKNEEGDLHPELKHALKMGENGILIGAILGGMNNSRSYYNNYIANSDVKIYVNVKDAQRQLARYALKGFVVGACKLAPLFGVFMTSFGLFCSCLQIYRNEQGIWEFSGGGFIVGALFRLFYGLKGMLVGGLVGSILGFIYGSVQYFCHRALGLGIAEYRYIQFQLKHYLRSKEDPVETSNEKYRT